MKKYISLSILLLSIIGIHPIKAQHQPKKYMDSVYAAQQFNGNVLVVKNNKVILEKSYGYSDGSQQHPLTSEYTFVIGSIYKEFVGVSIMQLQEKGLLNVEDKVYSYLPDLPSWSKEIAIKNLLQYSSGLNNVNWGSYFRNGTQITNALLLEEIKQGTLQFSPGTDYLYSNKNPFLLMKIVEKVSGVDFNTYVKEEIFKPLGMKHTYIAEAFPYTDRTLKAIPYNKEFKEDNTPIALSGVLINTTAKDLIIWMQKLDDFKLISKSSVQLLSQTAIEGDNVQAPLGRVVWEHNKLISHTHHGKSGNYEAIIKRYKKHGVMVVLLTNQANSNVHDISEELYQLVK